MYNHLYAICFLLLLDFAWIRTYMGPRYVYMIERVQKSPINVNYSYAMFAYLLMVLGLLVFVLPNIKEETYIRDSIHYGFLFGVILYGVYDFTAASVITNWDINLAIIDILWGGFVYFLTCVFFIKIKILSK